MRTKVFTFLLTLTLATNIVCAEIPPTPKPITVYIFLSETCPICQNYTLTLKTLYTKYNKQAVNFIGILPNYYSDLNSLEKFKKEYSIPFDLITDRKGAITKRLKATITPEVIIENDQKIILYRGRIDDAFYSLGKRRTVITSNDLDNALTAILSGKPVVPLQTQPVGCIITSSK